MGKWPESANWAAQVHRCTKRPRKRDTLDQPPRHNANDVQALHMCWCPAGDRHQQPDNHAGHARPCRCGALLLRTLRSLCMPFVGWRWVPLTKARPHMFVCSCDLMPVDAPTMLPAMLPACRPPFCPMIPAMPPKPPTPSPTHPLPLSRLPQQRGHLHPRGGGRRPGGACEAGTLCWGCWLRVVGAASKRGMPCPSPFIASPAVVPGNPCPARLIPPLHSSIVARCPRRPPATQAGSRANPFTASTPAATASKYSWSSTEALAAAAIACSDT